MYTCFIKHLQKEKGIVVEAESCWDVTYICSEKNNFLLYVYFHTIWFFKNYGWILMTLSKNAFILLQIYGQSLL